MSFGSTWGYVALKVSGSITVNQVRRNVDLNTLRKGGNIRLPHTYPCDIYRYGEDLSLAWED